MRKKKLVDESEMREFLASLGIPEEVIERFLLMEAIKPIAVSYTHLTLPTIYSV